MHWRSFDWVWELVVFVYSCGASAELWEDREWGELRSLLIGRSVPGVALRNHWVGRQRGHFTFLHRTWKNVFSHTFSS